MVQTTLNEHKEGSLGTEIRPFSIHIPDEALTDLRRRIRAMAWPEKETVADQSQGVRLATKQQLAKAPVITVPTITLEGDANGAPHADPGAYASKFSGKYTHRVITGGIGHNLPQEAPQAFAEAILEVDGY